MRFSKEPNYLIPNKKNLTMKRLGKNGLEASHHLVATFVGSQFSDFFKTPEKKFGELLVVN